MLIPQDRLQLFPSSCPHELFAHILALKAAWTQELKTPFSDVPQYVVIVNVWGDQRGSITEMPIPDSCILDV